MFIRGPEIVRDGLILYLDAANSKSFRGEPTENLIINNPIPTSSSSYFTAAPSSGSTSFTYDTTEQAVRWLATGYAVWGTYAYNSSLSNYLFDTASTYSISFEWKYGPQHNAGTSHYMNIVQSNGLNVIMGGYNLLTYSTLQENGWYYFSRSGIPANAGISQTGQAPQFRLIVGNQNTNVTDIYWRRLQFEKKSSPTPFIDGTRGTTVATGGGYKDLTKNANNYTLVGDVISQDNHLYFSGDQDYFQPDNNSSFNSLTEITLESWCYPMRVSAYEYMFSNARDVTQAGLNGYEMRINNGTPRITIWNNGSGNTAVSNVSTPINNWYHIVGTYNGLQLKIYVNGTLRGTTNSTLGIGTPSTYDLYIGRLGVGAIYEYQGYMDVSKVYNRALSDNEILQNYNALKSRFGL